MSKEYVFYIDPGHAWLEVGMDEIKRLGIEDRISRYSYVNGRFAYLEEDCDAPLFLRAMSDAGMHVECVERHTDCQSQIRGYLPYPQHLYVRKE